MKFAISRAKPLRLERKSAESDAATRLAIGWRDLPHRTAYLTTPTSLDVFKSASARLLDKIRKYESDLQFGNPAVRRVLDHIHPFVQQMGIMAAGPARAFGSKCALVADDLFNSLTQEDWDLIDNASSEGQMNLIGRLRQLPRASIV